MGFELFLFLTLQWFDGSVVVVLLLLGRLQYLPWLVLVAISISVEVTVVVDDRTYLRFAI